ncbi:hypothetical protein KC973_02640 [Candidatus Saccharibacteria bacterium]|nr:hypothetical protein [Candidatus Saccharibacteria bacterium]
MTNSAEFNHDGLPPEERVRYAPEQLVEYLRAEFDAAYRKERSEDEQGVTAPNGSFYVRKPLVDNNESVLLEQTTRIVMRPPFIVARDEQPREFVEVYAVFLRGQDGHMVGDTSGYFADQYIVREFENGHSGPLQLVTEHGVFIADTQDFDTVGGFGVVQSLEEQLAEIARPIEEAERLYGKLSGYNIVATAGD